MTTAVRPNPLTMRVAALRAQVENNATRVAELGSWPQWISPSSLALRIPTLTESGAGGFDAGIAAALGLIPRSRQRLAATLHAAYTPEAVAQVRAEAAALTEDSETTWWLAACSVCEEGESTPASFISQVQRFISLVRDPEARLEAARGALAEMLASFRVERIDTPAGEIELPVAVRDGGMQGAYIAGFELAAERDETSGLRFLGTFHPSLGLEEFPWREPGSPDGESLEERLGRSGPVHGSRQFVKCCDEEELRAALGTVSLA